VWIVKLSDDHGHRGFAQALDDAIAGRQVTLVWLRDRLSDRGSPVSLTTLSYWRSGHRHPEGAGSLAAIGAIEDLLGLAPGALVATVGPSRRTGPVPAPEIPIEDEAIRIATEETLEALGAAPATALRDVTAQVVADVDERGAIARRSVRILAQSTSGTIEELPWIEVAPAPTSSVPRFSDLVGARITRTHRHPGGQVNGFAFELERAVTAPDTALFEFVAELDADYPHETEVAHFVTRPARETLIWVRFHPDHLPQWCREQAGDEEPRPLELGAGRSVHAVRSGFGPGILSVTWGFG
jgi:hypothetical protein